MRAFTLIETLLYIALLSFILTAAVLTSYQLATNSGKISATTAAHDEGSFVLRKLDYAFNNMQSISAPSSASPYAASLTIIENDGTQIDVRRNGTTIEMREGASGSYVPLTSANVSVSDLHFGYLSGSPAGVEASTTIDGAGFMTRRYLSH